MSEQSSPSPEIEFIYLDAITAVEKRELESMGLSMIEAQDSKKVDEARLGDLSTLQIVLAYSPIALGVLGLWLMKPRKWKKFKKTIKIPTPSGTREETIEWNEYSSESPKEIVVKALSKLFGLSADFVKDQIDSAEEKNGKDEDGGS